MQEKEISIIGTGALGSTLARALHRKGFTVTGLYNRTESSLQSLSAEIAPRTTGRFPASANEAGELCFVTVPDDMIGKTAERLASLADDFSGRTVVHCSGSKTSAVLTPLKNKGAATASFHPLQTFTSSSQPKDLSAIYFDAEGDRAAVAYLKRLAETLESTCIPIKPEGKPYLHAAAVMSSNYLVALVALSTKIAREGGLNKEEIRKALLPLMRQSLQNVADSGQLPEALSGPVARGDASTVKEHLKMLEQKPDLLMLYKQLGKVALQIARDGDDATTAGHEELAKILE